MSRTDRLETPLARFSVALVLTLALSAGIRWSAIEAQDVSLGTGARCGPPVSATPAVLVLSTPFVITATSTPLPGADEGTTAALVSAVTNVASCWNARDWSALDGLLLEGFKSNWLGIPGGIPFADAMNRLDNAGVLSRMRVERAQFARTDGMNLATIEVRWSFAYASYADLWRFVFEGGGWRLEQITPLPPPSTGEAVGLSVRIAAGEVQVSRLLVTATETIALDASNTVDRSSTLTVLGISAPVTLDAIVDGSGSGSIALAGFLAIPAAQQHQLRLASLPAGSYLLVTNLNAAIAAADPARASAAELIVEPRPGS